MMAESLYTNFRRIKKGQYLVTCKKGHSFGVVNSVVGYGLECCYKALARALIDEREAAKEAPE